MCPPSIALQRAQFGPRSNVYPWQVWAGRWPASSSRSFLLGQEEAPQQDSASGGECTAARAHSVDASAAPRMCLCACAEQRRTPEAMFWRLHGNSAPPSAPGSNMTAEAAPGAVVTQIGMYLCCLRMFALSLRGCAVGLSCCYNPDHVLSAGTLSKCFSNAHGTGHNGADDQE